MLSPDVMELKEGMVNEADPLTLDLENDEFIEVINQRISDSISYYKKQRLYERQDKNKDYYLGKQYKEDDLNIKAGEKPYLENIVYEGIRRIKPIATSRLPDLTVKGGPSGNNTNNTSKVLSDIFNTDIKKRENRKLLGTAHVQERLFFYAWLKARWNPEKGSDGDYEFLNVHPKNMVWDQTCKTNNADDMFFVAENAELTLKELLMMFPDNADAFLEYLGIEPVDQTEKTYASKYKLWEVWFHWYKEVKKPGQVGKKWEKLNAVVWKYENFVLGKMRNPYFDYEGKMNIFTKEMKEKTSLTSQDFYEMLFNSTTQDTVYYNYFKNPRKPYFLMVYEPLGDDPIDATNSIEQILLFQDHINQEGMQINSMNEMSAGKPVFNADAMDKDTVSKFNWKNPKQAVVVGGENINNAFTHISLPPAPSQLYQSKTENRSIAFEMLGVNATTRGVQDGAQDQTLGQSQMFREADYGFIDDLVEETLNEAAEWMAEWSMQFIRLFYTKPHMKEAAGKDGESLYLAINQDFVQDGQVVEVSASGVDKLQRKRMAISNMQLGAGDLLSYYEDTEQDNAKERAYRAFLMKASPQMYMTQYLMPEGQGPTAGPIQPGQGMPQVDPATGQPVPSPVGTPSQTLPPPVAPVPPPQQTLQNAVPGQATPNL